MEIAPDGSALIKRSQLPENPSGCEPYFSHYEYASLAGDDSNDSVTLGDFMSRPEFMSPTSEDLLMAVKFDMVEVNGKMLPFNQYSSYKDSNSLLHILWGSLFFIPIYLIPLIQAYIDSANVIPTTIDE